MHRSPTRWLRDVLVAALVVATAATGAAAAAPQSWDRVIPNGAKRFKILKQFNEEAVLDVETGLVWHRSPSPTSQFDWGESAALCIGTAIGGRRGWRLPTAWELMTLKDPAQSNPALPDGHPFENVVEGTLYWTSTASLSSQTSALALTFTTGGQGIITSSKTTDALRWCVRGPGGDYSGTP